MVHRLINVTLLVIVLILVGGAAFAQTGDGFDLSWNVMGGGGAGAPLTGDGFSLRGTLGQTAIGSFSDASYQVGNGYWVAGEREYRIYLPLVVRNLE
ncbi:MAG: hypothetical protein GY832_24605 [Chloroflexi bacterium]|nr:hypothetical protein [Chloroflexota bacterium]